MLSRQEVARLLARTTHRRDRMLLMTTYAAGLRVSEVVGLQVGHLDSERMVIRIERGKGPRDRYALLTEPLLTEELLRGLGFALYRILVPVLITVLIAARCGAAVSSDTTRSISRLRSRSSSGSCGTRTLKPGTETRNGYGKYR